MGWRKKARARRAGHGANYRINNRGCSMNKSILAAACFLCALSAQAIAAMDQGTCESVVLATQPLGDLKAQVAECVQRSLDQDARAPGELRAMAKAKEAERARADEPRRAMPHYVSDFRLSDIDSAGGVNVVVEVSNPNKESPIKYLEIRASMYNAVGDRIRSDIGGKSGATLQFTGPLSNAQQPEGVRWEGVWYNSTATCARIESISVEFMNGKRMNFAGRKLQDVMDQAMKNSCKAM